jgi:tripartite-type tricarboxylate transporter receptor subunit TctC
MPTASRASWPRSCATSSSQHVIVDSRPGVGGRLAAQAVKAAVAHEWQTYMIAPNAVFRVSST